MRNQHKDGGIPYNIIAGIFNFTRKALFEVAGEEERQRVEVKF